MAVAKNKTRRQIIIALGRPVYRAVTFLLHLTYKALFWWLDIWSQREKNASLQADIQANLFFLYSTGEVVREKWARTVSHPFDYAVVRIRSGNVCFCFTRGQDQLNVLLAPRHNPSDTHALHIVIAALDSTDAIEQKPTKYLSDVAELLRPRLNALNNAFSENGYPAFREKLSNIDRDFDVARRQAEWELNKKLYY
jgi:hypothetical protein